MEIKISEEQLKALMEQLRKNRPGDAQSLATKETITLRKFEGEVPKACDAKDLVETIVMEFEDGSLKSTQTIKPQG